MHVVYICVAYPLREEKYMRWEWNYGTCAKYNMKNEKKFPWGFLSVSMEVEKGRILNLNLRGDFFGNNEVRELEEMLVGVEIGIELMELLQKIEVSEYIHGCCAKELYELIRYV